MLSSHELSTGGGKPHKTDQSVEKTFYQSIGKKNKTTGGVGMKSHTHRWEIPTHDVALSVMRSVKKIESVE